MGKRRTFKKETEKIPEITSLRLGELRPELEREARKQTRTLTDQIKHYLKQGLEADRQNGAEAA